MVWAGAGAGLIGAVVGAVIVLVVYGLILAVAEPSKVRSWSCSDPSCCRGQYSGLTGPATAAHFHGPAEPDNNAAVQIQVFSDASAKVRSKERRG